MREVVVTGGGTGIGHAIADAFAADGDAVTVTGRRADVLAEAAGRLGARAVVFDASEPAAVTAALGELPARVDVLVNNAGGNTDFDRGDPEDLAGVAANWPASLATELGPRGITASIVSPGLVLDTEFFRGRLTDAGIARRVADTRNGRPGRPGDVVSTVLFLASPAAGHITGQVVHANGGAYLGR